MAFNVAGSIWFEDDSGTLVIGEESTFENVHLAAEKHNYGYSKRAAAYAFLAYHLDLDYGNVNFDRGVVEDFVTILPQEDLKVFTKENPRPSDAIMGDEAIMKYLNLN